MKKKAVIWGTGGTTTGFLKMYALHDDYNIIAFTCNDNSKWGHVFWNDISVIAPYELKDIVYDTIIICSIFYQEIIDQLVLIGIESSRITIYKDIEYAFCKKIANKYRKYDDTEIQNTLKVLKKGKINVLGEYVPEENFDKVYRDKDGHPYINFYGKKMYFPEEYSFKKINGQDFVPDILCEQRKGSPHLYVKDDAEIPDNAIIVDAGVCEGNFALKYIDRAKKIYLIESDPMWIQTLRRTFAGYENKIIFCDKFLSRYDNEYEITLDTLLGEDEKIDFLKMDIEGAEVCALLGARKVLERSVSRCAICSYHRQYDEKYISFILESYGYQTSHSDGYICFPYDRNMKDTLDLRRGVIYAQNMHQKGE